MLVRVDRLYNEASCHWLCYQISLLFLQIWLSKIWLVFWGNSLHLWIMGLVLPFICTLMQAWLLDNLAISLDSSIISRLYTIKKDCHLLIEDQKKSFDMNVPRVGLIASYQPSYYHFIYGFANGITSVRFFFMLIH